MAAAALCVVAYVHAIRGEFVYDDRKQIVQNELIQDSRHLWTALTSDVWAFKGARETNWSNYWRPTFISWLIVNHRMFGLGDTLPWHAGNILLHAAVTVLAYGLLRELRLGRAVAAAIVFIFAVHPVHVESVAWISGSTDMLLALPMLASLWCVVSACTRPAAWKWVMAVLMYIPAIGAKEAAILYPLVVFATSLLVCERQRDRAAWRAALGAAAPFAIIAIIFMAIRQRLLGQFQIETPWQMRVPEVLATLPSVVTFYLRQMVWPQWIGPSYPLRAVRLDNTVEPGVNAPPNMIGLNSFLFPLAVVLLAGLALGWAALGPRATTTPEGLARRDPVRRLGLVLLALTLLPAMNVNAFIQEQLVHDRYLYLPLLGFLMVILPATAAWLDRRTRTAQAGRLDRGGIAVASGCLVLCVPLLMKTRQYAGAWTSELALWTCGVQSDPTSSYNWSEYARALIDDRGGRTSRLGDAVRMAKAKDALDRALRIRPVTTALLNRAHIAIEEHRLSDAEVDLRKVLQNFPETARAYKLLAMGYNDAGRFDDALSALRTARDRIPGMKCGLTQNLAVVLYQSGRKPEALAELESVRALAGREYGESAGDARKVPYNLGCLYVELGRKADGASALREFLSLTSNRPDVEMQKVRAMAQQQLAQLSR